ncbi:MAG: hypothetical protein D6B28_10840, partial [Gammaproteobacteria bacterium]
MVLLMEHRVSSSSIMAPLVRVLAAVFLFVSFGVKAAQPSAEQMRIFQSLTPEQQQEALAMYGDADSKRKQKKNRQLQGKGNQVPTEPEDNGVVPREAETSKEIEDSIAEAAEAIPEAREEKEKIEFGEIKQFGYDLFAGTPTTFAPAANIPVPLSYVIGPDDNVVIQLYGKRNGVHDLLVTREGHLNFPGIGPILVAGMTFAEMRDMVKDKIDKQLIGVKASITLGVLRSIRIFVLGEVERPGSYTVSSLSTMTNALFVSGGIKGIGSLRKIQLKRAGKIITEMDLYDLLLRGDTSSDVMLKPGDVIFVPPIGKTVGITGGVRRPAIYEIKNEKTVELLLDMAGGLLPTAYASMASIQRINESDERVYKDIDLKKQAKSVHLFDGDVLKVYSVLDKVEDVVLLQGHVRREIGVSWFKGMRLSDAIPSIDFLLPNVDLSYVLVEREVALNKSIKVISANLEKVFGTPKSSEDINLLSGDKITVFKVGEDRAKALLKLVEKLKQQATQASPAKVISIYGNIKSPGEYPLHSGMTLKEAIFAGSNVLPRTDLDYVIIRRVDPRTGEISVLQTSLSDENQAENFILKPEDAVYVFHKVSDRQEILEPLIAEISGDMVNSITSQIVNIEGQVRFPGDYPYIKEMNVDDLVKAAGGYLQNVYMQDAEITRFEVKNGNKRHVKNIKLDLNLQADEIEIKPYDRLFVRQIPDWSEVETVEIWGEVKFPGVYTISKNDNLHDLVQRAGGLTSFADPSAAIFTRESLKEMEEEQLQRYRHQLNQVFAGKQVESAHDK